MTDKIELQSRLAFWKSALEKLQNAYLALIDGNVKSYRIDDRELNNVDELTALLGNQRPRKAFGVIPRDF